MFTEADVQAVTEFTRIARMIYPRLVWESLTTEAGQPYLLVYDGAVSWFVEPVPAVGGIVPQCWAVIASAEGGDRDHVVFTGETPAGALEGAIEQLHRTRDKQMEDA